jgi:hypothetical protein
MFVSTERDDGTPIYNFQYLDTPFDALLELGVRPFVEFVFSPRALARKTNTVFWWGAYGAPPTDLGRWAAGPSSSAGWSAIGWPGTASTRYAGDTSRCGTRPTCGASGRHPQRVLRALPGDRASGEGHRPAAAHRRTGHLQLRAGRAVRRRDRGRGSPAGGRRPGRSSPMGSTPRRWIWLGCAGSWPRARFPQAEIHLTEWSSSSSPHDHAHDTLSAATYVVRSVLHSLCTVDSLSYWTFTDGFEEGGAGASCSTAGSAC